MNRLNLKDHDPHPDEALEIAIWVMVIATLFIVTHIIRGGV